MKFKKQTKYRVALFFIILIVFAFFLHYGLEDYRHGVEYMEKGCFNSINTAEKLLNFQNQYLQMQDDSSKIDVAVMADGMSEMIETSLKNKSPDGYKKVVNVLNAAAGDYALEMLLPDGEYLTSPGKEFPAFSESQLRDLEDSRPFKLDGYVYAGSKTDNYLLIGKGPLEKDVNVFADSLKLCENNIIVFDSATGDITAANSDAAKKSINELGYTVDGQIDGTDYTRGHFKIEKSGSSGLSRYCRFVACDLQNGHTVIAFFPLAFVLDETLTSFIIPFVLTLIFAIVCFFSCIVLTEEWKSNNLSGVCLKLFGLIKINGSLTTRVVSMLCVCGLIALSLSSYFIVLPSVTNLFIESDDALETVDNLVSYAEKKKQEIKEQYEKEMLNNLSLLDYFLKSGNGKINDNLFKKFAKTFKADTITIFDSEGNIEYDSKRFTSGYKLSSNPEDPEYALWKLINGEPGNMAVYCDEKLDKIYFASSRSDRAGIIRLTIKGGLLSNFAKLFSQEEVIQSVSFPDNTLLVFGKIDDTSHLTCYDPDEKAFYANKTSFPDNVFTDGYSCLQPVRGGKNNLLTKISDGNVYISINENYSRLIRECLRLIGVQLILFIIICLIILRVSEISSVSIESREIDVTSPATEGVLVYLDKTIVKVFRLSLIAVAVLIVLDYFLMNENADLKYWLISNNRPGVNLYSIGYSFFAVVLSVSMVNVVGRLSQAFCRCIPAKKVTFCQLLTSLLQLAVIVAAVTSCMKKFGITPSQMLAFLGVSGLALGIGARDVINDFIAGTFIILDRNINVGDYIEVGNFFGKVVEINIRTTKIQHKNRVISINNSNMRNVINNSAGLAVAAVNVLISYRNRIDDFIDLINKNQDKYKEADVSNILENGPFCKGITAYEKDGARVSIAASVRVEKKGAAEVLLNTVTKRIIEKSDIVIPDTSTIEVTNV